MTGFGKIAPYLSDPLVLVGFVLFVGLSLARALLGSDIIPPVGPGRGADIVRLLLHYGFATGLIVIVLGFGLKYRELSQIEQRNAVGLIQSELDHNLHVVGELQKNTTTLTNAALTVAEILRDERFPISSGLFPPSNINPDVEEDPDLYNKRYEWLASSGLLQDSEVVTKHTKQMDAVVRTINRTESTIRSLADRGATRYIVQRSAFDSNLPILRKVRITDTTKLAELYAQAVQIRQEYFRVADSVVEYLVAVREFCATDLPDHAELGGVLASERLTVRLLEKSSSELDALAKRIKESWRRMELGNSRQHTH